MEKKRFKVKIRRNLGKRVRENAEQTDGHIYLFQYGWIMGEDDSYPGEVAWVPQDPNYPDDAPHWIASGDLEEVK